MANRYTDTEKWKNPFFRGLSPTYKLFWIYLCDQCDHAGIWSVDFEIARVYLGVEVDLNEAIKVFAEKVIPFQNGKKWFVPSSIEFQQKGRLRENNNCHRSIIQLLKKYDLLEHLKGLVEIELSPCQGATDGAGEPLASPIGNGNGNGKGKKGGIGGKTKTSKPLPTIETLTEELGPLYPGFDLPHEFKKMKAWLLANPGRKFTKRFVIGWLNRADPPIQADLAHDPPHPFTIWDEEIPPVINQEKPPEVKNGRLRTYILRRTWERIKSDPFMARGTFASEYSTLAES